MQSEPLLKPVPIRFSKRTKDKVRSASRRFGLPASEIVRQAVENQLPIWETAGYLTINSKAQ